MTTQELKALILELMKDIYDAEYIGKLKVDKVGDGWCIKLGLDNPDHPLTIYTELQDEALIKFLRKEFHARHLVTNRYFSMQKVYKALTHPINTKCCDERCTNRENG